MPESFIFPPSSRLNSASACRLFCLCSVTAWSQAVVSYRIRHTHSPWENTLLLTCNPWKWEKSTLLSSQHRRITWNLSNDYFSWVSLNFRRNWRYIAKVSSIYKQLLECCMTLFCDVNSDLCCLKKAMSFINHSSSFHTAFFIER